MKILVTGASGFVGKSIVAKLVMENMEVFSLGSPNSFNDSELPNVMRADISDLQTLLKLDNLKNIDVFIHSAGLAHQFKDVKKDKFWKINVEGTKNAVELALKLQVKHFILISSVSVYGKNFGTNKPVDESFKCLPEGVYAQSKLESEKIAIEICEKNQVPLTILRLSTVIGELDRGNTARLIKAIDKKRFIWIGKGNNYKSLIYKEDVARACFRILTKNTNKTEIFNISAAPILMKDVVSEISNALNKKNPGIYVPEVLLDKIFRVNSKFFRIKRILKLNETVEKWLSNDMFSSEKIALEYGFYAEVPVGEGIRRQVLAYKNQK